MKSKLLRICLIFSLAAMALVASYMIFTLFRMPLQSGKDSEGDNTPDTEKKRMPVANTVIEVGKKTEETHHDKPAIQPQLPTPRTIPHTFQNPVTPNVSQIAADAYSQPVGKITYILGTVTAVDKTGKGRLVMPNADVFSMDRIESAINSKVEIKFNDGTVLSLGPKTSLTIEESIFDPLSPKNCGFILRFSRGVCRVVTGLITELNPDRFRVRVLLATAGIRGCDLVFKSTPTRDDIYILDMGRTKSVDIETTSDGSPVMNPDTGKELKVYDERKRYISVTEPNNMVSITSGKGPEQKTINVEEVRNLITETSHLVPARYELHQGSDGAVLRLTPGNTPAPSEK